MKKLFLLLSLFLIVLTTSFPVYSQFSASEARKNYRNSKANDRGLDRYKRYTSIGGSINAFNYFGDLAPWNKNFSTDISFTRPGIGLVAMRRLTPRVSIRGTYTFGRIRADDFSADHEDPVSKDRYRRNLHFRSTINELAVTGILDILKNSEDYSQRPRLTPYVFLGLGVFHHNPQAQLPANMQLAGKDWVNLRPLMTEGVKYSSIQIAVPLGIGVRVKLAPRLDLSAEIGVRQLYFDYLDDVSNVYVDPGTLPNDQARIMAARSHEPIAAAVRRPREDVIVVDAQTRQVEYTSIDGNTYTMFAGNSPGRRRGNPNDNDLYIVTSFQLSYILLPKIFKPKHRD